MDKPGSEQPSDQPLTGFLTDEDLRELIRFYIKEVGSLRKFAKESGYSPTYISFIINGVQPPSKRFLAAMGLKQKIVYVQDTTL